MPRYQKLGTIEKRKGLQLYEYCFNYGLLPDDKIVDVFIVKKPKNKILQIKKIKKKSAGW